MAHECEVLNVNSKGWFSKWIFWSYSSVAALEDAEAKVLLCLKTNFHGQFVNIELFGRNEKIWTISLNKNSSNTPLLMLHGFGSGVGLWAMNLDYLSSNRPVYAIDLLGFGKSSRPTFSSDAAEAETQLVESVEKWRNEMNIDKFYLLGHSFGGFIAASYCLKYPEKVKHLLMVDPWGIAEKPNSIVTYNISLLASGNLPNLIHILPNTFRFMNPLWLVRAAGPFGQWIIKMTRRDIIIKFKSVIPNAEMVVSKYIYQCNAQKPSAENAFCTMMHRFGWAKRPFVKRINKIHPNIPITMLYGSHSWMDHVSEASLKRERMNSYINVQVINGAGHQVYIDKPEEFNKFVQEVCLFSDFQDCRQSIDNNADQTNNTY